MGQQLNKIVKRIRRKKYLARKKELAKAGITRKTRAAAKEKTVKKTVVKKAPAKKAAKPKAAVAAVVAEAAAE